MFLFRKIHEVFAAETGSDGVFRDLVLVDDASGLRWDHATDALGIDHVSEVVDLLDMVRDAGACDADICTDAIDAHECAACSVCV